MSAIAQGAVAGLESEATQLALVDRWAGTGVLLNEVRGCYKELVATESALKQAGDWTPEQQERLTQLVRVGQSIEPGRVFVYVSMPALACALVNFNTLPVEFTMRLQIRKYSR